MDVTVREATSDDGAALLPLWREFTAHLSAFNRRYAARDDAEERWIAYFEDRLVDSADGVVLVAETGGRDGTAGGAGANEGEYVGVLEARIEGAHPIFRLDRRGRIEGLYVREDVRNRGVGRALLEAAEAWFAAEPRGVDFYRIEAVEGDDEVAAALRGLDLAPVTRTYEGEV